MEWIVNEDGDMVIRDDEEQAEVFRQLVMTMSDNEIKRLFDMYWENLKNS
jgi:molybdate-binding protein